ncbi:putative von Willebrand factor type A domain-containing protein [Schistosoma mansoni]|uniref:putative von Willebrand factor type A domain-containing protein n=1 Tax=Schistosoma mansoni TaxID=6183 RepID=UPI00022DD113|nr:putative von Willebrand factor type A domain-containing protein [Schistosoma mansoni]|eukprot:XP_018654921.1 putative von Willebrand factor type A domain-containing protein [Schistosoma mansoni]
MPPIYTYGPCYKGVSQKKVIIFRKNSDCICVPFVYNIMKQCPCGSPTKIIYNCPNNKTVKSYIYEKRVNGKCKKFPLKRKHTKNCIIRYVWKMPKSRVNRKKRSVQLHTLSGSKCGPNQHYVPERNPCPETCEGKFFGVESRCSHLTSGPGCECLPGFMRDGILCVPPSQCGCLESVCIDRISTEKCKLWRAEGRCHKDKAIMQRFCRATCQRCERPCEDQIATSQCELIKRRGECNLDFYKSMCMLTCSQRNCNCPARVLRVPGKCNYCKGFRKVYIRTYFREEIGFKRCLMIERSHEEKCSCDRINLALKTCQANKIPVVKTMVRVQTSCDKCIYRKINVLGKPIECKKPWIERGKCKQTHPGQVGLTRKVIYAKEVARNCKCQLVSHEETEICGCPKSESSQSDCQNGLSEIVNVTYSLVNGDCKRHVLRSVISCSCPNSKNFVKCDSENGIKLFGTIKYKIQKDGTCQKVELIESHKINCMDEHIRRISECNVQITEDNRMYRQLLVAQSSIKECTCITPKPKVYLEACNCPEAQTHVVKQIQQCPSWCFNATPETCDQRCQNIFIWQKLVYDFENRGHCKVEILQKIIKPCCCKHSKEIRKLCSQDGKTLIIETEESIWKNELCIKKVKRIHQPIQCKIGLLKQALTNLQKHGKQYMQSVYGYQEHCQCKIRVEEKLCNQSCPEPVYEVECDSASRELVHKKTDYVSIACSCQARIYKRRTKVSCPKDRVSEKKCDISNNKLISVRIHYELLDDDCLPQKDIIEEPVSCDEHMKMEIRRNNGREIRQLLCHRPTGRAQLITHVWIPKNCKCVRVKQVIREGLCNCPPPIAKWMPCNMQHGTRQLILEFYKRSHCHCIRQKQILTKPCGCALKPSRIRQKCDPIQGILQTIVQKYEWNDKSNDCVKVDQVKTIPVVCRPRVRITRGKCTNGKLVETVIENIPDASNCTCIQKKRTYNRDCRCPKPHLSYLCENDRLLIVGITYYTTKQHRCGHECMRRVRTIKHSISCLKEEEKQTFCRNGQLEIYTHKMILENVKCVKSTNKQTVPITCSKAVKIKYGECRPQTCRRPLFLITSVVDPDNCKCKIQQTIKEERECCCLGKSHEKREFCVGNCIIVVNKVSKFDKVNERCVKENFIRRKCPKCPKPHILEGTCDSAGTCLKTNRHISYTIKNCQCQRVEQIRHERCCCPASKQLGGKCVEDKGIIENKNIYYRLENGQCIKRETIEEKQIICPKTIQQNQSNENQYCDPNSCQQIVTTYQWNKIGCKCIQQRITIPKLCCCTNRIPRIKRICSPDGSYKSNIDDHIRLKTKVAQLWKLHNGQCVKTNVVKNLPPPVCKPQDVTPIGPCDKTTGKQPILITRSIIEECECKVVYREKRDRICACQSPTVDVKPCDPNTCLQQITTTKWAIEEKDKKCHRLHPDIKMRPCCCRREVNKDNLFKKCIPTDGQTEITNRTYYFNPQKELCEFKDVKTLINLVCPTEINVVKGSCNLVNGIALDSITSWEKLKSQCKCVKRTNYRKRICSCKHLDKQMKNPICSKQTNMLLQKKIVHELQNEICQPKIIWMKKVVVCPSKKDVDVKCDPVTCNQLTTISWFNNIGCKCEKQQKYIQGKCCCPKPVEYSECTNNGSLLIIKKVTYKLDEYKGKCVSQIDQLQKNIACPLPVIHKENCTAGKTSRKVWRIIYTLRKSDESGKVTCEQEKEYLYEEPCHCRKPKLTRKCQNGNKILMKHVEYLVQRNDKRFCSVRHYIKRIPVNCRVNAVRMKEEPCENSLKRITFMHEILDKQTCECRSQVKVEFEKCDCDKDNRITEFCQNGVRVVNKEINVFSQLQGRCVKSTVRSVRPVVCLTKHQVIKSSGCVIERSDGIYYSEEIRWEQAVNCKCVIKRRQILRLCACPKPTIKKQCLDTVNLATYKNTFVNIGGQCIPDQEVITTETRCQEKAQIIDRSTCESQPLNKFDLSRPPCLETLKISVPTIVNCQCQLKTIQIQRRCCTSRPKVKQICDPVKGRWVKAVENYVLASGSILFKRDDLIVYDQIQKVTSEQQDQTVVCPQPVSYENCDRKTGLLTTVKTYYKRIGCKCKPIKEITRGKCGCPPRRQWISQCKRNFRIRRVISFTLINGTCVRQQQFGKQRCGCPNPMNRVYCDGDGRWVKCNTQYVYNPKTHACRLLKHCVRWFDECPRPKNRIASQCNLQTQFKQLIQYVHFAKNKSSCKCDAIVKNEWTEYCGCNHLNQKVHQCLNHNTLMVDYLKYTLIKGDCVPKRMKYTTQLDCPKSIAQHYPCNHDQNSPDRGYSISKIRYFISEHCKCIPKEKLIRRPCNCTLIYPQMVSKRCYSNKRLLVRKRFSTLVKGKCLPSEAVYKRPINCQPLKRINVGRCQIGPGNVGTQRIDELHLTSINCQCKWRIKHSERKICKCPDPIKKTQCYNNGRQLMHINTIYSLDGDKCKPSKQLFDIDPCVHVKKVFNRRPLFQIGQCNPVTCKAKRVDYRFFTKNCRCEIQKQVSKNLVFCGFIGCPTAVRHIPGKCINQWAIHKWIGLNAVPTGVNNSFQITEKLCKPVVIEERRIRCACPPMQVFKKCLNHSLLVIQRINYKLNKELNNCERYNTKEFKKLACPNTQITQSSCGNKLENYEQVEVIKYRQANQCNCLMKVIRNKWICNCHARYPNQVIKKCLPNGYQRLTITKIWFNQGRQCLNRTEKRIESIACPKNLRIIKGQCSSTGNLQLIYLLQRPQHCQCVWQKLTDLEQQALGLRPTETCKCRPSFMVKQCHEANNNQTAYLLKIYTNYILQQGECHIDRKFEKNPVVCQVGSQLHRSQCNPVNNELIETKITTYLRGCECQQKISKRRCQCSCPKPKTNAVCQSRDGLLRKIKVIHAYKDDQCTCEAKYYVQSSRIRCYEPPKLIKIGKCHKLPQNESAYVNKNDLYRNLIWNKLHRVGCQCQHKRYMEQFPCYCSPDIKHETQCINDRILEIRRTERKISEDKRQCIRVVISKVRNPIHLGEPEYNRKCNPKTGIETVVQKLPYIENCKRQYRVNVIHRRCKCNTKPRLVRQSECSPECKVRYTWLTEKITPEGQCKFYYRVQEKSCCCPTEVNLGTFCNRSIGLLETGYRTFKLINGKCVSKDRFVGKQIVCKMNEKIVKHQQPNGWIRIEKQFSIREGCNCVRKLIVDYDKWNCPPPVTQRRCVQASSKQFVLETVSTKWKLSESKPTCSRLDTIIDRVPIDCSEEYVNKSDKCVMIVGRHALVRIDQVTTFHADGCRCIENSVRQVFTVCKCTRPHREKSCLYSEGVLIYQNVYYEVSGDKSRCLPRRLRRVIKITCSPVGPQYKGRTQCDTETGNFFHVYEELKRVGCQCLKKELRIPGRCRCPERRSEMRCSTQNVQQLNTTTYELSPKGTCIKSDKLQYKYIKCLIADDLLQESTDYKVQQSQSLIRHIYKCGSAGKCMRIIQEYKTYTNYKCKCITERKQYREACCCPTEPDMIQFNLPNNSSQSVSVNTLCDPDKGLLLTNTIRWNLEHGKCWPVVHRTVLPVVCDKKEFFKPITVCRQGQQKNLHQREVREGCKCKLDKRIVTKPCACDPVGIADVVFLVDETVKSRQMNHSYYVNKILKYTVNVFYESSQSSNIDEQFRFGLIKYSLKADIVSNLKSYPGLYELYAEIKKLTFNGRQSDLRVALNIVKSQILPQIRPGASLIIYLITDAIVNQPTGIKQLSDYLKSHNVQINAILLTSEHIYDEMLFKQLVSPPTVLHLVKLKGTYSQFASHLSRIADTICKKACPVNHKKESQCSRQTNCIGRIYNYMYRYNPVNGLCIGKTIVERKQCCCMQEVRRKTTCENNHLIQYTENWQLTTNGFCEQYVTRRDVTGLAISQCTPANQTFIKTCNIRGEAVQVTIYRYMKNCKCKTKQTDKIVRCRCTKKHNTKTCFGDDLIVYHYHFERLLEGECLPQRRDVHKKLACKRPKIFKSPCDSLTCQERITIVNYVPQRCTCKRFVTVKHQTCCCKGNRTSNYVGCKHNDVKVFEEKVFDSKVHGGSCVQRVSYYFQPITCPNKPSITYHSCRRFNGEASVKQRNYENDKVDPGLIYRLVEKVNWKIQDCDCRRYYESYFEACGCDESVIINNSVTTKNKCDRQTGVIMNYKLKVRLEIVGIPYEYTKLNRLNKLSDAKCRPYYVIESVRKIKCPKNILHYSECKNGKMKVTVKVYKVHNCECQESIRRLQVQCNKPEKSENMKQVEPKSSKHILTTVGQITDCIDLLPSENCLQLSRSSKRICEKSSRLSDLLCRRTCRRCLGCELNNIRYQMISANYPCAENDQHILNTFLFKTISTTLTLASCKLACANQTNCLSFIYSISHEFDSNIIDKTTKSCSSPKLTEISKCECKVYKNYYGYPSESPKFKTSLHCSKLINVEYYIQSQSGICQKQNWQGYTPCSNPRYRDLPIRNLNNCNNLKSSLWCEAQLADDQRKCKDEVFSRLCSKTCGLCTCYGINIFNGKCNSTGYKLDTHIIYKSHPINRICIIEMKKYLSICEYCPIGTFEYVRECDKLTRSRSVDQITARLIKISPNINGKPRFECSIQTKNYKFECGNCLAAYRNKYSITSCRKLPMKSAQMKTVYQLNLITEYVVSVNGCCKTKRTERRFNCENCSSPRIKYSPCYNKQRLKHIIFYTRPWVTSSLKPGECIQRTITRREKCTIDHRLLKGMIFLKKRKTFSPFLYKSDS